MRKLELDKKQEKILKEIKRELEKKFINITIEALKTEEMKALYLYFSGISAKSWVITEKKPIVDEYIEIQINPYLISGVILNIYFQQTNSKKKKTIKQIIKQVITDDFNEFWNLDWEEAIKTELLMRVD